MSGCRALLLVLISVIPCLSPGQPAGVTVLPLAGWVQPADWESPSPLSPTNQAGVQYLLLERQHHALEQEMFLRTVMLLRNETGVQDSGNLSMSFDPEYQTLILHQVQIHRNGRMLDRLLPSKIKLIQPESGLDDHLYTGRKTAVMFIEDLRVGDVLEYAFTIRGANPILGDHFSTRLPMETFMPVDRRRLRVVWPFDRTLHMRQHPVEVTPIATPLAIGAIYLWDLANLKAQRYEDGTPPPFEQFSYCELSDFENWARVVEWALPLYNSPATNLPPELRKLVDQWCENTTDVEDRARLALEFVQDNLRYTGLEMGPESYRPAPVAETFERRFGDCKGKALLLCVVLRAMNIEAWPVLVNASAGDAVSRSLPSPFAFDHVIVKLRVRDRDVWVDPTLSHQGGTLWNRHVSRFGKGLVVRSGAGVLEDIPSASTSPGQHSVSTFRIRAYDAPAEYTVTTTYRGVGSDTMREQLARQDRSELLKTYLNFSARYYPGVTNARPLEIKDDRRANVLTVSEHYELHNLWTRDKAEGRWEADFYADSLYNILPDPTTRLRKNPLHIPFPFRRTHEVVVHLPDSDWKVPEKKVEIDDSAFHFLYNCRFKGSVMTASFECETRVREIPADLVAGYLGHRRQMEDELGVRLYHADTRGPAIARLNWLMVIIAAFGLGTALLGGTWIWHRTKMPADAPPPLPEHPELQGLGGWLILVGFGLCMAPIVRASQLLKEWEGFFSIETWQAFAMPGSEQYHALFGPVLAFEVLGNCFLLGTNVALICFFFGKRRLFPKLFIAFILSNALFLVVDEGVVGLLPSVVDPQGTSTHSEVFKAVFQAIIWSLYMVKSRRVRTTFVQ
jgi:hypothetical protein